MARRILLALVVMAAMGTAVAASVSRQSLRAMEVSLRDRLGFLVPDATNVVLSEPHGVYLNGYGAVFTAEVNLTPGMNPTAFGPRNLDVLRKRAEDAKKERVPMLRRAMKETLIASAASLDGVPATERLAVSVSIFIYHFEQAQQKSPYPSQIVMQAPRQALLDLQAGRGNRAKLEASIVTQEF